VPASPPPPSGSCFSSPKANCYTSYGCGRGPDTLIDKGRWSGGDDITRKSPRKVPRSAAPSPSRRQTDRQTDTPQHPLGASRRPKNHAGFHCTHAPTSERQYFSPRCHPLGPKNLRTDSGKLARPQRKCQTFEHTTNDSKQAHAVRCGKDVGGRNAGPRKLRQGGSGGEGHQCYHLEPPVISPARRTASRSTESAVAPPPSHATSAPPEGQTNGHRWGNMRRGGAIYTSMSSASTRPSGSSQGPS